METSLSSMSVGQGVLQDRRELATQEPYNPWRYTRYGWQDSTQWRRSPDNIEPRMIDRINPILFSIDIILAVLGAMIWASEEWQVDRLFGRPNRPRGRASLRSASERVRRQEKRDNLKRDPVQ